MKKRIVLLAGTFAALLAAFLVYYSVTKTDFADQARGPGVGPEPTTGPMVKVGEGIELSDIPETVVRMYDENHRLSAEYSWDKMAQRGGRYHLDRPRVEWFLSSGQQVHVEADRGLFRANPIGGKMNPNEGELIGNVRILLDRRTRPGEAPIEQRPEDAVRIQSDDISFDRDSLTIQTDSVVNVYSQQADFEGKGLRLSWDEVAPASTGRERAPRSSVPGGPISRSAKEPPQTRPAADLGGPPPVVPDTYLAVFSEDVVVTSGTRNLRGADELRLVFEARAPRDLQGGAPEADQPKRRQGTTGREAASAVGATGPAPVKAPAAGRAPGTPRRQELRELRILHGGVMTIREYKQDLMGGLGLPGAGEGEAPKPQEAAASTPEPIIVTWTGPLVVTPVREPEKYLPGRLDIAARGRPLTLADEEETATCEALTFDSLNKRGELVGLNGEAVELQMADGGRLSAPRVQFDRTDGTVHLQGPGQMYVPAGEATGEAGPAGYAEGEATIRWKKDVKALVGRHEFVKDGKPAARDYVRQATFSEDVVVEMEKGGKLEAQWIEATFLAPERPEDPTNRIASLAAEGSVHMVEGDTGDFIKTDRLDVEMDVDENGNPYPRQAVAKGAVTARQEDSDIAADELTVHFSLAQDEDTGEKKVRPRRLDASGHVKITDRRGREPVEAEADTLTSDLISGTAVLTGKDARITQKLNELTGENIVFDKGRQSALIDGSGTMRFWTDTDLSGNKLDEPQPVDVRWNEKLDYRGLEGIAIITGRNRSEPGAPGGVVGGVELVTSGDSVHCNNLRVLLAKKEQGQDASTAEAEGGAVEDELGPKSIDMVIAKDNVVMVSVRRDAEGYLERRLDLRSEHVVYEAKVGRVNCIGAGRLSVEDYGLDEPGAGKPKAAEGVIPGGVERPSQTFFWWSKSMDLDQDKRIVRMEGDVRMVHRSGKQMVLQENLNIRPRGQVLEGRSTTLACDRMLAQFGPASADASAQEAPGMRVGPLELFDARGQSVRLSDGPREVLCQRLLYQQERDVAILWGSLPGGSQDKDAYIYIRDDRGGLNRWKGRKLVWHRQSNRIESGPIEAQTGG